MNQFSVAAKMSSEVCTGVNLWFYEGQSELQSWSEMRIRRRNENHVVERMCQRASMISERQYRWKHAKRCRTSLAYMWKQCGESCWTSAVRSLTKN
jgi:hypothetical protein